MKTCGSRAVPSRAPFPDEHALIGRVRDEYRRLMKVGCTGCGYCMPCPAGWISPAALRDYNAHALFPHDRAGKVPVYRQHGGLIGGKSHAGLCRQCGKCAKSCPQHLPIPSLMKDVSKEMEGMMGVAVPVPRGYSGARTGPEGTPGNNR